MSFLLRLWLRLFRDWDACRHVCVVTACCSPELQNVSVCSKWMTVLNRSLQPQNACDCVHCKGLYSSPNLCKISDLVKQRLFNKHVKDVRPTETITTRALCTGSGERKTHLIPRLIPGRCQRCSTWLKLKQNLSKSRQRHEVSKTLLIWSSTQNMCLQRCAFHLNV